MKRVDDTRILEKLGLFEINRFIAARHVFNQNLK